jgi:pimeloyl-ACP methyl ester carboxylesterase
MTHQPTMVGLDLPPSVQGAHELGPAPGKISANGTHYRLEGPEGGKFVLLLHGIGDFSFRFSLLFSALVNAGFRVLTIDFFGRGWSVAPARARYDMDMHIQQIECILDEVGVPKDEKNLNVVAHSMGGCVATYFAAKYDQRVQTLTLMAPAGAMAAPIGGSHFMYSVVQFLVGSACSCCIPLIASKNKYTPKGFIMHEHQATCGDSSAQVAPTPHTGHPTLSAAQINNAPALQAWDVAWMQASVKSNCNRALVASAARLPLDTIGAAVPAAGIEMAQLRESKLPVLVVTAVDDIVIKGVQMSVYEGLFGDTGNVTKKEVAGGHCFFLQDPENALAIITAHIQS